MSEPFMVAISGGSGSGKTTFVNYLTKKLSVHRPLIIPMDHYYRDLSHLSPAERSEVNFDHPETIERELLHEHISLLRAGLPVDKPIYDFSTHTRKKETESIKPAPIIILDGIFSLCYSELYRLLDLKLFINVDADIRVVRRIRRDMAERGRSFESCAEQYLGSVKEMHKKYIEPSQQFADFIIPWHDYNLKAVDYVAEVIKKAQS